MSDKQNLQETVKSFVDAKKEAAKEVSKVIEKVHQRRQAQAGQSNR
ncbi:hypothetical protein ES705_18533 [subsurface metagenome]